MADEARADLASMPANDGELVAAELARALGAPGREHRFGVVVVDGAASRYWRTYAIPPYTAIFRFMTSDRRNARGLPVSAHLVAAIPNEHRLSEVMRRLYYEAQPDDGDWH